MKDRKSKNFVKFCLPHKFSEKLENFDQKHEANYGYFSIENNDFSVGKFWKLLGFRAFFAFLAKVMPKVKIRYCGLNKVMRLRDYQALREEKNLGGAKRGKIHLCQSILKWNQQIWIFSARLMQSIKDDANTRESSLNFMDFGGQLKKRIENFEKIFEIS